MNSRAFRLALLPLAVACAATTRAQNALPSSNPFGGSAAPTTAAAAEDTLEFAGVSAIGPRVDLIFQDKATKKTSWVPLGGKADGIEIVNFDQKKEQVVVRHNGTQKTLTLRKSTAPANAPAPVAVMPTGFNVPPPAPLPTNLPAVVAPGQPAPTNPAAGATTPAAPATPMTETQRQEQEARMLVADLLEIGMAQRKAYEDAQRKAQEGGSTPAAQPTAPTTTPLPTPNATNTIPAPSAATPAPGK